MSTEGQEEDQVCTYCLSGDTLIHQEIFTCITCSSTPLGQETEREGGEVQCFCLGCAQVCHRGHETQAIAYGRAYCK